ncbi:transcription termination factor MTERF8, chloroplastic-like isoform X2 [Asparagus officinalis]|uniref:transcription termination factor MTERF8, chloroplastic-like isoform X1 n=1 Tax=Asparagus officinalis TaxID=4686 RepID=UPI00098E4C11|nr:transcription termination factor MTERF8, chloroplastic-like isoform X1 [Asparagus officinalis]XP_020255618.1 transcription termination factor MTERF8, chloroplastic-like isoform X2 [Asparagus officinalis]
MILFLKKSLSLAPSSCSVPKNSTFYLQFFSSSSAHENPEPKSNPIADYLMTSCGFSSQKAANTSKHLTHRRFPANPDSVRHFFKHNGFTEANIKSLISNNPAILWADVGKTLVPNLQAFCSLVNFSDSELRRFIVPNSRVLTNPHAFARLEFWKTFLNNDMKKLLLVFARNRSLIGRDIDKSIAPKIALLKSYGLSSMDISMLFSRGSGLIMRNTASFETSIKKVEELGFPRGSPMFVHGLATVGSTTTNLLRMKIEIFKSFGWSESMFFAAIKKFPNIVLLSEQNIREKMEFLLERIGYTQDYIASRPTILGYSLEKRLKPRHQVWEVLKSDELVGRDWEFYSLIPLSHKEFFKKIVLRYKDLVPNLYQTYISCCASQILS